MKVARAMSAPDRGASWRSRRAIVLFTVLLVAAVLLAAAPVHERLLELMALADGVVRKHRVLGMSVFVVLAAVSAMVAFFSSVILIPPAVYAWGPGICFVLLWAGWFAGGVLAYTIGRYLGRPVVEAIVGHDVIGRYELSARSRRSLAPILMLQLAVPSDLAGYLFGLARCRFRVYVVALAIAEVPYALGAVYLGESFVQRRLVPLLVVGGAGVLLSVWAFHVFHRRSGGTVWR